MYVLVTIDHYSKWYEARHVKDHDVATAARFLEEEMICRFGVLRFILIDNGGEWVTEFDLTCKKYGITQLIHSSTMASMQRDDGKYD
jgi:hypothetical protein